uniref:Uncharacterized protein MANES_18G106700 n=1 Tax=Rhizophora mucronata TaxID=61149 RepID=A0A2P2JNP1_RHIMU
MDGPPANDCCSVCRGNFNVPCQANCSHWFCGYVSHFMPYFPSLLLSLFHPWPCSSCK